MKADLWYSAKLLSSLRVFEDERLACQPGARPEGMQPRTTRCTEEGGHAATRRHSDLYAWPPARPLGGQHSAAAGEDICACAVSPALYQPSNEHRYAPMQQSLAELRSRLAECEDGIPSDDTLRQACNARPSSFFHGARVVIQPACGFHAQVVPPGQIV